MEKEKDYKFTNRDCKFVLLAKHPDGKVYQVKIKEEEIHQFIVSRDKFELYERAVVMRRIDKKKDVL